jgi:cytochrome c oxidase subunit II
MLSYLGLPAAASAHAGELDFMLELVHWFMLVLFVGWSAFFVVTLLRYRQSRNPRADYTGVRSHSARYVEIGVVAVEAVLLIGFAIPAWAVRVNAFPPEQDALHVRIVGEQFAWNIHYPGPDGRFGRTDLRLVSGANPLGLDRSDPDAADDIVTINQLNLPVDRPVVARIASKDVIHSFWVPELRVKQDAIPGMEVPVWFVPTVAGDYEIVCSQLCGLGHYRMRGFVEIQSQEAFEQWLEEEAALMRGDEPAPAPPPTGEAQPEGDHDHDH